MLKGQQSTSINEKPVLNKKINDAGPQTFDGVWMVRNGSILLVSIAETPRSLTTVRHLCRGKRIIILKLCYNNILRTYVLYHMVCLRLTFAEQGSVLKEKQRNAGGKSTF